MDGIHGMDSQEVWEVDMKRAFLRIDDFPYSGLLYARLGRIKDQWMYRRFMNIVEVCEKYGVVPDVMVSSHVLNRDGSTTRYDDLMPETISAMKDCQTRGLIAINAHGMIHINRSLYLDKNIVDAREFLGLSENETRNNLTKNINFIYEVFGKSPVGFVAPAWGYQPGLTKEVASEFFAYIADSYDHWEKGDCLDFGTIDPMHGYVHFPETWRYGKYSAAGAIVDYWEQSMRESDLVHMMQHGFRISGKWRAALTPHPIRALSHLIYGNLRGIFVAAERAGLRWGNLEKEALDIKGARLSNAALLEQA